MSRTEMHDMRFVENFKIFVGGPSRCGKTFFVVDLIQNLKSVCKKNTYQHNICLQSMAAKI